MSKSKCKACGPWPRTPRSDGAAVRDVAFWVALAGLVYLALFFLFGDLMRPGHTGFATFLLWATAHALAYLCERLRVPPLLGMLLAGLLLRNLPFDPVKGFAYSWSEAIRSGGLALILLRSGLELDWRAVKRAGGIAMRLTVCPGTSEALVAGALSVATLGLPVFMGLSLGFILGAVSPAVVVSGMFALQKAGYGIDKGIPSLVVAASSLDDVTAIMGFSLCSGLAVPSGGALWKNVLHGPMAVGVGLLSGITLALMLSATALWNSRLKRSLATLALTAAQMYLMSTLHLTAAGALGALSGGLLAMVAWQAGFPRFLSLGPSHDFAHETEHDMAQVWKVLAQPLLFSAIGAEVDFRALSADVVPRAIGTLAVGLLVRLTVAFSVLWGGPNGGLSLKERGFIALSWIPKATVQAALASTPLDMVMRAFPEGHPHHDAYVKYARDVLATAVLSIILTAPLGLVLLNGLGPRWLTRTANPAHGQGREKSAARERSARPALPSAPTAPPTPPPLDVPQSLLRDADALARLVTDDPDCAPVRRALLSLAHVARRQPRPEDAWDVLAACRGVLAGVRRARADAEAALRPRLALDLDTIGNFFALVGGASGGARIDVEPARGIYGMPNTRGSSEGQGDPRMDAWSEADLEAGSEPWADLEGLSRKGSEGGCTPRLAAQGLEQRSARVDIPCSDGLQLVPLDRRGKDEGPCAEADQDSKPAPRQSGDGTDGAGL